MSGHPFPKAWPLRASDEVSPGRVEVPGNTLRDRQAQEHATAHGKDPAWGDLGLASTEYMQLTGRKRRRVVLRIKEIDGAEGNELVVSEEALRRLGDKVDVHVADRAAFLRSRVLDTHRGRLSLAAITCTLVAGWVNGAFALGRVIDPPLVLVAQGWQVFWQALGTLAGLSAAVLVFLAAWLSDRPA